MQKTESQIVMPIDSAQKGRWIYASRQRGAKLQDYVKQGVDMLCALDRLTLGIPELASFEGYVLAMPPEEAKAAAKMIRALEAAQEDAAADLKMIKGYLDKRIAIAKNWGTLEGVVEHDITADMLEYNNAFPQTSASLMRALLAVLDAPA